MIFQDQRLKKWVAGIVVLLCGAMSCRADVTNLFSPVTIIASPQRVCTDKYSGETPPSSVRFSPAELRLQPVALIIPLSAAQRRWSQLDTDFSISKENPRMFLVAIEAAKHLADWISLELRDWVETMKDNISFDYELRNLTSDTPATTPARQIRGNLLRDVWENTRFQSDINLRPSSGAFIGIKLTLPIGD